MTRREAEDLAMVARRACSHDVDGRQEGDHFVVEVTRLATDCRDTNTLYDDADWSWLSERIVRPNA